MYHAIVFLPLIGFLIAGIAGRQIGDRMSQLVTAGLVSISAILSWMSFTSIALGGAPAMDITVLKWVSSGDLHFDWAFKIDTLTAVMLVVVNSVSALVHWYSVSYMDEDPDKPRFFAYLSLFTFAMLMLVTSNNLVQMFFGWEGVGLASYLLIGFWYKKKSASDAAIKAFVVNRVGDFGFSLGIFACFWLFGTVGFDDIFANAESMQEATVTFLGTEWHALTIIGILLFIGAMGKSAQLGLHTWLPDAMEGPTPVSALIHAATMVTAGVFLVARFSPVYEFAPDALAMVTVVGAMTAFFAATVGLVQNDIKRVIAYSTCSQLGYMFFALGVGAFGAGIFHLFTHAFFKALLFLGAGSVIHAMHHEQDMRNMGGLWKKIPQTFAVMLIGTLAITGIPLLSGYYSKDAIILAASQATSYGAHFAFVMAIAAALCTSFYSWRLMFMTFFGKTRADQHTFDHAHEGPLVMRIPLFLLAAGALAAGMIFAPYFIGELRFDFWNGALVTSAGDILDQVPLASAAAVKAPFVVMCLGLFIAMIYYRPGFPLGKIPSLAATAVLFAIALFVPFTYVQYFAWVGLTMTLYGYIEGRGNLTDDLPQRTAETFDGLYAFLLNKWYFDELFDFLFVRPAFRIGSIFWKKGDGATIDGFGPDGVSALVRRMAATLRTLQTGYLYHYAFAMLIGVALVVTWFMTAGGGH